MANPSPSSAELSAAFDAAPAFTVGIEEELMLLDPETLELAPRALDVLARLDDDARFKAELPASQLEILTAPHADVRETVAELQAGRQRLAECLEGEVLPAAAGVSPLGSGVGELNDLPPYAHTLREYGPVAGRQLVCALQVHVAVNGAERALAVYNAARGYLPLLAALAANAAVYEGRDTGFASIRPKLSELLPRQGVPPALESWEEYAEALRWGAESGAFPGPGAWWWELRPRPRWGTLEFRVPDSQRTIAEAAAIAAVIQALVVWLAGSEAPAGAVPTWRIEENRWSACRHGVEGSMADLETGAVKSTREALAAPARGARAGRRPARIRRPRGARLRDGRGQRRRRAAADRPRGGRRGGGPVPGPGIPRPVARVAFWLRAPSPATEGPAQRAAAHRALAPATPVRAAAALTRASRCWPTRTFSSASTSATNFTTAGLPGVDERWEWDPSLLGARAGLESVFEAALEAEVPRREEAVPAADLDLALREIAEDDGPSLSAYMRGEGQSGAVPRVPDPSLGLPAQGGRPALLGHSAPGRERPRRR